MKRKNKKPELRFFSKSCQSNSFFQFTAHKIIDFHSTKKRKFRFSKFSLPNILYLN